MSNVIDSEEKLIQLGFKKYPKVRYIDDDITLYRYQKRYDDDVGKKYFIDCVVRDDSWRKYGSPGDLSFEFETQLYLAETHTAFNITFLTKDIDEITEFIESMFEAGFLDHYELFD